MEEGRGVVEQEEEKGGSGGGGYWVGPNMRHNLKDSRKD